MFPFKWHKESAAIEILTTLLPPTGYHGLWEGKPY
jgi:hypothetical protein